MPQYLGYFGANMEGLVFYSMTGPVRFDPKNASSPDCGPARDVRSRVAAVRPVARVRPRRRGRMVVVLRWTLERIRVAARWGRGALAAGVGPPYL